MVLHHSAYHFAIPEMFTPLMGGRLWSAFHLTFRTTCCAAMHFQFTIWENSDHFIDVLLCYCGCGCRPWIVGSSSPEWVCGILLRVLNRVFITTRLFVHSYRGYSSPSTHAHQSPRFRTHLEMGTWIEAAITNNNPICHKPPPLFLDNWIVHWCDRIEPGGRQIDIFFEFSFLFCCPRHRSSSPAALVTCNWM